MFSLNARTALVTGASRGIGAAIALALAKQGAWVAGTATTAEGAERYSQQLAAAHLQGQGFVLDVCDEQSIQALLKQLSDIQRAPDILVNNAGITRDSLLLSMKASDWQAVLETNLTAVYRLSQLCLRSMLKIRFGRIINLSSIVGVTGNAGQANYAAAKAGLIGFSKSLALEVAKRGITVNVVAPGFIETDMTAHLPEGYRAQLLQKIPSQTLGKPEDVAAACVFLASDSACYITGHTLQVNGGLLMV